MVMMMFLMHVASILRAIGVVRLNLCPVFRLYQMLNSSRNKVRLPIFSQPTTFRGITRSCHDFVSCFRAIFFGLQSRIRKFYPDTRTLDRQCAIYVHIQIGF